jgi:hypothetical protein
MENLTEDQEPRGKVDAVAVLYIAFGVPGIFGFIVVLFSAVKLWNIPA